MLRKKNRSHQNKQTQRQKVSRRTVVLILATSLSCLVIGLTLFFNLSHVDRTKAATYNVRLVTEQVFTNEKSIEAPMIDPQPSDANTIWVKQAKPLTQEATQVAH